MNMRSALPLAVPCLAALSLFSTRHLSAAPQHPTLPFTGLTLVEEIDCSQTPGANFHEEPSGASTVQTILGQQARVMANAEDNSSRYFSYLIGQGKGLEAGKAYVLEVEYPEDAPRAMIICNTGEATTRGFHTGRTVGDALKPPYVTNNGESLEIPLQGGWRKWRSLFHLHDRTSGIEAIRGNGYRPLAASDGFWVTIAQYAYEDEPLSHGAAVSKIRLYEAPSFETYDANIQFPPEGLPRRHLFVREEMADGIAGLGFSPVENRGVANSVDYYEYKARHMRFLGMNTFAKDLLEFGSTQGWDTAPGGGNNWYYVAPEPKLWEQTLDMLANYDLDVLPYYEYCGAKGSGSGGVPSLGFQKRAVPLNENLTAYTHITWAENARADIADPDTLDDARLLLDATIGRFKDRVKFLGAWFRPRSSQMPISFNDNNLAQFSEEVLGGTPITRAQLKSSNSLYQQYRAWWFTKRRDFVVGLRDHLRATGVNKEAILLLTSDPSEPGRNAGINPELIAEDQDAWTAVGVNSVSPSQAESQQRHRKALLNPRGTWGGWEWQHADPENDPANYSEVEGAMLTYTFNKAYTLSDASLIEEFRTQSGLAMVRHYSLNEDAMDSGDMLDPLGYFVSDMERSGPYTMMAEALALAKGDPRYIGYLSSNTFNRGFPEYVRAFNRAFLALPAVPSIIRSGASSDADVVVRDYPTDGYGTYIAVINTATTDQSATVTLPFRAAVKDATTGAVISSGTTSLNVELYPFQVLAFHLDKQSTTGAVAADDAASTNEGTAKDIAVLANDSGPGTLSISSVGNASNGTVTIIGNQVRYTPAPGFYGTDSFRYTVTNGVDEDHARVNVTVADTAVAHDLTSWGVHPEHLGAAEGGYARILADGVTGELRGFGSGIGGSNDAGYYAARTVNGDFEATLRLVEASGTGDSLVGLMLRQGMDTGARMVTAYARPGGALRLASRSEKGESSADAPAGSGYGWVRIKREGDLVTISRSSNGTQFTEVGWRLLPGLPTTLHIGAWVSGGDPYEMARGVVTSFSVNTTVDSAILFAQDFSSSSSTSAYVSGTGAFGTFADISSEANSGPWEITEEGALLLPTTSGSGEPNDAGFTRTAALSPMTSILKVSARVSMANVNTFNDLGYFEWGNFTSATDYGSAGASSGIFARLVLKGNGNGAYHFRINGTPSSAFPADGRMREITLYMELSGTAQAYTGPDGSARTLDPGCLTLWVGDQAVIENRARESAFTAANPARFKFRSPSSLGVTFGFDDIVMENRFAATTPGRSNAGPVAVNDSTTTPEGQTVLIDVLANDSDSDAGPEGLHITNVTGGAGAVSIEGGKIRYVPSPGYYGTDTFSYTISDGAATSSANVQVQVQSTALASDLSSEGLEGLPIGTGSAGESRILADEYLELRHVGTGSLQADNLWWEELTAEGDFQVEVRIRDLQALAAGGAGGLMLRESNMPGGRMARIGVEESGTVRILSRTVANASATQSSEQASVVFPAGWLQLERAGDIITLRISEDGMNFTDVDTVQLPGLAHEVTTGLWAANARFSATGFIFRPHQEELMKVDFENSPDVSDYMNDLDPEPNQFNDIGGESLGGTWSIDNGRLRIVRTGSTGEATGAGFIRSTPFPGPPQVLQVSMDIALSNVNVFTDLLVLELGNFPAVADYNNGIVSATIHSRLTVKGGGSNKFVFRIVGTNAGNFQADGNNVHFIWYVNNSGATANYKTPDNVVRQLDHGRLSLWAGGALLFDNVTRDSGFTANTIAHFRVRLLQPGITAWFDNITVRDEFIPNVAPVVQSDTASTDEGVAVNINVLSNDSDPDNGPQSLSIFGVSQPANGATSIVSGQIQYVPAPGFHGQDTFTYTATDGAVQRSASVTVTVNDTSIASDLTSEGLDGVNIGSGSSGSSRILASGDWELLGSGAGMAGTASSFRGELAAVQGDFEMIVRVDEVTGGNGARIGLVAKEGSGGNGRMIAIHLGGDGILRDAVRSTTSGTAVETADPGSWSLPGVYLLIRREGEVLKAAASTDGTNFDQIRSVTLSGLASELQIGLSASSSGGTNARGVVDEFLIDLLNTLFAQNFNDSTTLSDYISSPPSAAQFDDLKTDGVPPAVESWSIVGGKLRLARTTQTNPSGFTRLKQSGNEPSVVQVSFKASLSGVNGTWVDIITLDLGAIASIQGYNSTSPHSLIANRLVLKGAGTGYFYYRMNGVNASSSHAADGTEMSVVWVVNHSSSTVNYAAPGGGTESVASGKCDLWVDNVKLFDDATRESSFLSNTMGGFRLRCGVTKANSSAPDIVFEIDDLEVRELIP